MLVTIGGCNGLRSSEEKPLRGWAVAQRCTWRMRENIVN
jgi:hypothetical protein